MHAYICTINVYIAKRNICIYNITLPFLWLKLLEFGEEAIQVKYKALKTSKTMACLLDDLSSHLIDI